MQRSAGRVRIDPRLAEQIPAPPVVSVTAELPGPSVVVTANVHGDECTGVLAAHALDGWLTGRLVRGAVTLYPSLNPVGLAARTRGLGNEGTDLNRLFPGEPGGGPGERLAAAIWRDIQGRSPDALVDLHADSALSIPYAIVDRPIGLRGRGRAVMDEKCVALAHATGLTVLRDYPADQYTRFGLDRSLAGAMVNKAHVPAVTIEAGPRRIVDPEAVAAQVAAVIGVLVHLGMVDLPTPAHPTRVDGGPWRRSTQVRTRTEGLFVPSVDPGTVFQPGVVLGEVRGLLGDAVEEVRASEPGVVVSWLDAAWVAAGGSVGTFGVPEEPSE